jgi:hypothetical protein
VDLVAISTKRRMTACCSSSAVDVAKKDRVGRGGVLGTAVAWAHPHMPRRRKRARPFLASTGQPSPSAAVRNLSYCSVTLDAAACSTATPALIAEFFFR